MVCSKVEWEGVVDATVDGRSPAHQQMGEEPSQVQLEVEVEDGLTLVNG